MSKYKGCIAGDEIDIGGGYAAIVFGIIVIPICLLIFATMQTDKRKLETEGVNKHPALTNITYQVTKEEYDTIKKLENLNQK